MTLCPFDHSISGCFLLVFLSSTGLLLSSCSDNKPTQKNAEQLNQEEPQTAAESCERLFGQANENTGLSEEQCAPRCLECQQGAGGQAQAEAFEAQNLSDDNLKFLRSLNLLEAPEPLGVDPYQEPQNYPEKPHEVCALRFEPENNYRLINYPSEIEAQAEEARITHTGACGACSSLQDLAVYIETPDLTEPVRNCALNQLGQPAEATIPCLEKLGFSPACAEIWAYNTKNTRDACFSECISAVGQPYHQADGMPNACIQCDEEKSGPVFKAVSGRTRRNSGLPTALCRPCNEVSYIDHQYR